MESLGNQKCKRWAVSYVPSSTFLRVSCHTHVWSASSSLRCVCRHPRLWFVLWDQHSNSVSSSSFLAPSLSSSHTPSSSLSSSSSSSLPPSVLPQVQKCWVHECLCLCVRMMLLPTHIPVQCCHVYFVKTYDEHFFCNGDIFFIAWLCMHCTSRRIHLNLIAVYTIMYQCCSIDNDWCHLWMQRNDGSIWCDIWRMCAHRVSMMSAMVCVACEEYVYIHVLCMW